MTSAFWTVYWTFGGTDYYAQATSTGPVITYTDGTLDGSFTNVITGSFNPGPNGTITWTVPRADVGNPSDRATLTNLFSDTRGSFTVFGGGLVYNAAADRGPDSGYGAPYIVAKCNR